MVKLYSQNEILMPDGELVPKGQVFEGTPAQAKAFDKLAAARPATADEIKAAAEAQAAKDGLI